MTSFHKKRIAIIGAGTVGLSVALRIIEVYDHNQVEIEIIAAEFLSQTTSYGSGGLWEPYQITGTDDEMINQWGKFSFEHFKSLYYSKECNKAGVQLMTAYQILEQQQEYIEPSWKDIVFNFQFLHQNELSKMGLPNNFTKGYSFGTFVIDQKYYMQYLTEKLTNLGVIFKQQRLDNIEQLINISSSSSSKHSYDCIVNCSGLGSSKIINDTSMYPIRGQVLRVKAPWMKDIWFFGTSYIIPNIDNVVLGGTSQKNNWDTTVSLDDTNLILNNICKVFPSIRNAPIENIWVGLRPGRSPVRLDHELINTRYHVSQINNNNKYQIPIIHCYGHGGSGITLAMGCANDVVMNHIQPLLLSASTVLNNSINTTSNKSKL